MSDPDKMVSLGEITTRDGAVVKLHRDYEDLMFSGFRLTPESVAVLEDRIAEWKQQVNGYILRAGEDAAADASREIPDLCAWHGGEGSSGPGCPDCAAEDEYRQEGRTLAERAREGAAKSGFEPVAEQAGA